MGKKSKQSVEGSSGERSEPEKAMEKKVLVQGQGAEEVDEEMDEFEVCKESPQSKNEKQKREGGKGKEGENTKKRLKSPRKIFNTSSSHCFYFLFFIIY